MRARGLVSLVGFLAIGSMLAIACGGSDDGDATDGDGAGGSAAGASGSGGAKAGSSGAAGKGGTAGTGGTAGAGGTSGASGASGKAGSGGTAGTAGKGGGAGTAGTAGSAGTAGKGGSSGSAGSSGSGGNKCTAPLIDCGGGACVDTQTSPQNCNMCGKACPVPANATATCAKGACGFTCKLGFDDCDGKPENGCEHDVSQDPNNCGKCGKVCPSGGGVTAQCKNNTCSLACTPGTGDCDGLASNGCEADTNTDAENCGVCGFKCGSGTCVQGGCGCGGDLVEAKLLPLDLYVMFDKSGSMSETTASGQSKWDAVKAAVDSFVNDPQSTGIGVGLQYFPIAAPGVPDTCTNNSQCGAFGPCDPPKGCRNSANTITMCDTDADCQALPGTPKTCAALGLCANNTAYACFPASTPNCGMGLGACQALASSCINQTCSVSDYATPDVPIAELPGNATNITQSLTNHTPDGGTPTRPALQGAVDYATTWANANPTHTVVVLLATDGMPNDCSSNIPAVSQVAATGFGATPSIRTFVIGVFSPTDITNGAQTNLDQIASAGGGQPTAFIVDTSQNVTQQFIDALNKIRKSQITCQYAMPTASGGGTVDPNKVNMIFTDGAGNKTTIVNVGNEAGCDPQKGGWYYDDPANPTKILTCPASCDAFQVGTGGKVEIQVGCATIKNLGPSCNGTTSLDGWRNGMSIYFHVQGRCP